MASRGDRVVRHGTARDADSAPGYTASGASEHSRNSAHGSKVQVAEPDFAIGQQPTKLTRLELIRENRRRLAKIEKRLLTETDPDKIAALKKSFEFKSYFLHKLEKEQRRERAV